VEALLGTGRLEGVRIHQARDETDSEMAVRGLFVFIGAEPRTQWLAGQLAADSRGFLLTGADIPAAELGADSLGPLYLESSRSGIFAIGDVRSGSVKRVSAAIGEGAVAVRLVFDRIQAADSTG
jgi:thioredoxin reductase (NADPH)